MSKSRLFIFFCIQKEKELEWRKIFDFRFLMDLHVMEYPEHNLTIFGKCLVSAIEIFWPRPGMEIPRKTYQSANFFTSQKLIATVYGQNSDFIWPLEYDVSSRPINSDFLSRSERMGHGPISWTIYVIDFSRNVKYG